MKTFVRPLHFLVALSTLSTGCVFSQHQKSARTTPPAVILDLPGVPAHAVQATLETVIVYDGPGAWKRRAFWDEYVVSISNRGPTPVRLITARLFDAHTNSVPPGHDWPALEKQSADWWKRNATPDNFALGAGLTVLVATGSTAVFVGGLGLAIGAAPLVGAAAAVALVSCGAAYLITLPDEDGRREITAEFERRRFQLPAEVLPGDTLQGSLFFRVTPSPRQLRIKYEAEGTVHFITVDLTPLHGLHLKNTGAAPTAAGPVAAASH